VGLPARSKDFAESSLLASISFQELYPISPSGSERSSRNALKHGYTGQTLVLTPEEAEACAAHVSMYMETASPPMISTAISSGN
jgi:hypothetical protein